METAVMSQFGAGTYGDVNYNYTWASHYSFFVIHHNLNVALRPARQWATEANKCLRRSVRATGTTACRPVQTPLPRALLCRTNHKPYLSLLKTPLLPALHLLQPSSSWMIRVLRPPRTCPARARPRQAAEARAVPTQSRSRT